MISSPTSLVLRSRSADSITNPSASFTICSILPIGTGRFSQARNRPFRTFWRSNFSRRPSFLTTMYGISSMRSYVVKRFSHLRHSRRRRMESASLLSRESTTLSFANPQKGHFMGQNELAVIVTGGQHGPSSLAACCHPDAKQGKQKHSFSRRHGARYTSGHGCKADPLYNCFRRHSCAGRAPGAVLRESLKRSFANPLYHAG